jgi:hypothetical protein
LEHFESQDEKNAFVSLLSRFHVTAQSGTQFDDRRLHPEELSKWVRQAALAVCEDMGVDGDLQAVIIVTLESCVGFSMTVVRLR